MIARFGIPKGKRRRVLRKACLGILIIVFLVMSVAMPAGAAIVTSSSTTAGIPVPAPENIVAESFASNANKDTNILTIDKPSGVVEGEFLIAQITYERGKDALPITAPAGWTLINGINAVESAAESNDGTDLGQAIYWKGAGSQEPSSYTWKFNRPIKALGGIIRYSGVNIGHPEGPVFSAGGLGYNQKTFKSNGMIAPGLNGGFSTKLIAFYSIKERADLQTPVEMTRVYQQRDNSNVFTIMASDENWDTSAPTGPRVAYAFKNDKWDKTVESKVISHLIVLRGWLPTAEYTVTFHSDGDNIDPISVFAGSTISRMPAPTKDNMIFLGWFTDNGTFANKVTENMPIDSNLDLYAFYLPAEPLALTDERTSTSVSDVAPDYRITVRSSVPMSAEAVKDAITTETTGDGEGEFGGISVTGGSEIFTVAAIQGFTPGGSYTLTLTNDALTFDGQGSNVRTYNITVTRPDPVLNVRLKNSVKAIPTADIGGVTQNGMAVDSIFAPLFEIDDENNEVDQPFTGTFVYSGERELLLGDTLAVYEGTAPDERIAGIDYSGQNIAYVTVTAVSGTTISYTNAEVMAVLFTPEVFPVNIQDDEDGDPGNASLTIEISNFTDSSERFTQLGHDLRHDSSTVVEAGDFLAFYEEPLDADALIGYARITAVMTGSAYHVITYETTTVEALLSSMNIAASQELTYDQLNKNADMTELEEQLREQVTESGFIDSASDFLVKLANTDEDTRDQIIDELGISNFSITETENPVRLAASQDVSVDFSFAISRDLEHYEGEDGLKCDITVTCEISLGENVSITVTGTFTQEIKIELDITGEATLAWALFIPIPIDFTADASVSIYSYTSLALNALLTTSSGEEDLDIRHRIAQLEYTGTGELPPEQKSELIREFYEIYQDMLAQEHDYFELFKIPIVQFKGGVDPLHLIGFGVSVDFVVSVDANVSLGVEFGYEKATRYSVHLESGTKTATTKQTDLVDGDYAFIVYLMGTLGLRAGVKATVEIGFIDVDLDSVGFSVELGAYWRMWGFVYYELVHENNVTTSSYGGGVYMELGIYLEIDFIAQVLNNQYEYVATLFDQEWPLLAIGDRYYVFDYTYVLDDSSDDIEIVNAYHYMLPDAYRSMYRMDYKTGSISSVVFVPSEFTYTIEDDSLHAFSVSEQNNVVIRPPANTPSLTANLVVAWNRNPLSFTSSPLSRTFELNWSGPVTGSYYYHFETNGGFPLNSIRVGYGYMLDPEFYPTPRRTGYTFTGWFSDSTFEHVLDPNVPPDGDVTLYARWQPDYVTYAVRIYQEQLNGSFSFMYSYLKNAWADQTITDSTYDMEGFATPQPQTIHISPDSSTVVEHYYERLDYTYTFRLNNGGADIVGTMPYGTRLAAPSLVKTGYTFAGWNPAVPARLYDDDVTYEAQWLRNEYAITYHLNGGSVASENPLTYNVDSAGMTLVNPTRAGYVFIGWTGTGLSAPTMTVMIPPESTGDRYYTATWTTFHRYDVRHIRENLNGDYSLMELEFGAGGAGLETDAQPKTYEGFTAILPVSQQIIGANNETVVSIYYARDSYTLTFDAAGGEGGGAQSVKYGDSIYAAYVNTAPVSREGYYLTGWSPEITAVMAMPAHDMTFTAQWTRLDYVITYNLDGGSVFGTNPGGYNTSSDTMTIINPTKPGYTFIGWTGTGLSAPTLLLTIPTGATGDRHYTANWIEDSTYYTLTFDASGGEGGVSLRLMPGEAIIPPTVTRLFYIFLGWDAEIPTVMPENDLVFHAIWDPMINIFTFDMNGAEGVWAIPEDVYSWTGSPGILPSRLVGTGVELAGWSTYPDGSTGRSYGRGDFVYVLTPYHEAEVTLYAQWKPMDTFGVTDAMYMFTGQTFGLDENDMVTDAVYDASVSGDKQQLYPPFGSAPFMYFRIRETGDSDNPFALYLYKCEEEYGPIADFYGHPLVPYDPEDPYSANGAPEGSLIGSGNNDGLTPVVAYLLEDRYGSEWEKGLVTVGNITMLWEDSRYAPEDPDYNPGFVFTSVNGVRYFISGRTSYSYGMQYQYDILNFGFTVTNANPTITEIEEINNFRSGPTSSMG